MPDIVVHHKMGQQVYEKLKPEITSKIYNEIFRFGIMGPDVFFYYQFYAIPIRKMRENKARTMHKVTPEELLAELAKHGKDAEMFSYLCGMLCHYACDNNIHPYIYMMEDTTGRSHSELEKRLDQIELKRQRQRIQDRPITRGLLPPYLPISLKPSVDRAFENVYGWENTWRTMKTAYRNMKECMWIIEDPIALLDVVISETPIKKIHPALSGQSYRMRIPEKLDYTWYDTAMAAAVEDAIRLIDAAEDMAYGRLSEEQFRKMVKKLIKKGKRPKG